MKTRNGKVARLPRAIRNELNRRLANNEPGGPLLDWLNGLPEVQEILTKQFEGVAISKQNLSEWRTGGYAEWEARQDILSTAEDLAGDAQDIKAVTDGRLADHLSTILGARYAALLANWNGEVTEEFEKKLKALRGLCRDIVQLRRADHSGFKLQIVLNEQEAAREKTEEEIVAHFEEWLKRPAVYELACRNRRKVQKEDREIRELLGLRPGTPIRGKAGERAARRREQAADRKRNFKLPPSAVVETTKDEPAEESCPVKPGQSEVVEETPADPSSVGEDATGAVPEAEVPWTPDWTGERVERLRWEKTYGKLK